MTESCGMCAIMPPECFRYDTVGLPVPSIEIKVCFVFHLCGLLVVVRGGMASRWTTFVLGLLSLLLGAPDF
jgi:long-subunit acyl-CoA synthetase (AMP-forming)